MTERDSPLPGLLRLSPSLPFVGRTAEIAALAQLGAQAARDGRRIAIVQGESGSGKTRLARRVAEQAAATGAIVLYGACDPSLSLPYQPIVEALEQLAEQDPAALAEVVDGPRGAELAALMPELSDRVRPPPEEGPQHSGGRFRLHGAIADALCAAARSRPVVLVLDDIHWAEAPTLHLLRHLARATADARLLVLATARHVDADAAPDLADALAELRRQDGVTRVQLGGITTDEIEELIAGLVPGVSAPATRALAGALADLTDGNVFLVAELAQHLVDAGLLEQPGATTSTVEAIGIPQGVREVIDQRLTRMADTTREVLELVAMGPRGMELPVLRAAMPGDDGSLLRALDEAVRTRMLVELPGTRIAYGFRHELLRRAVADGLPAPRRAALHLRVATALERAHGVQAERAVNDLALHFAAAADLGGREPAVRYGLRAAELAMRSFAYEEAARRLRAALELGIDDPLRRAHALLALGDACHRSAHAPEALESYAATAALARELGDDDLLAAAAIGFENACWRPGISDARSLALLEEANALVSEDDGPQRVRLLAALSRARATRGDHRAAAEIWQRAVEMARDVADPRSIGVTLMHAVWTRGARDPSTVLASLDEAIELFGTIGDVDYRHEANSFRLSLLLEAFDTDALHRELPASRREVEHSGQPFYLHVVAYMDSTLAVCDGRLADARGVRDGGVRAQPPVRRGRIGHPRHPALHAPARAGPPRRARAPDPPRGRRRRRP